MPLYEHVFLSRQDASAQQVEDLTTQFKGIIEQMGGSITKLEQWGVKSLSYRLSKNRKAHFTLMNIDSPSAAVAEMERQMSISEDVIRYMTIKVDALEEGPSAQMRRRDEREERPSFGDDRGFGFGGGGRGFGGDRAGGGGRSFGGDRAGGGGGRPRRDEIAEAPIVEAN